MSEMEPTTAEEREKWRRYWQRTLDNYALTKTPVPDTAEARWNLRLLADLDREREARETAQFVLRDTEETLAEARAEEVTLNLALDAAQKRNRELELRLVATEEALRLANEAAGTNIGVHKLNVPPPAPKDTP